MNRKRGSKIIDITSDRGPDDLSSLEGDFVHSIGLALAAFKFSTRAFLATVAAWREREGLTEKEAAERLGLSRTYFTDLRLTGNEPSVETMMRFRVILCGNQLPGAPGLKNTRAGASYGRKG